MGRGIEINGVEFCPEMGVDYGYDFQELKRELRNRPSDCAEDVWFRTCLRKVFAESLWAWVAFVLKLPFATHPFVVEACLDVQRGPNERTCDIWARGHCKSTIITCARALKFICNEPEKTLLIFSYTKQAALKFFNQNKHVMESSEFLKWLYPDVLWSDATRQAPKWSEDAGLFVQRKTFRKEPSLFASGLLEGMPTGGHFDVLLYDDVMVEDLVKSPDLVEELKERFDISKNLMVDGGWQWVVGTPYTPEDLIEKVRKLTKANGEKVYHVREKPATVGGEWNGDPVFISREFLEELKLNRRKFASQQLLNPTPTEIRKLDPKMLKRIDPSEIPKNLFRFMVVDPAGERKDRPGDAWAIHLVGVEPYRDDLGLSDIYILDSVIAEMGFEEALESIVQMYLKGGRIIQLGVEKVGQSTAEIHVANALRIKGRNLSLADGTLAILRPGKRTKADRIESALVWPLNNGKIHISTAVPQSSRDRLECEMNRFPLWHDDGLDGLSYVYDLLVNYRFGSRPTERAPERKWLSKFNQRNARDGWLVV